eukprot:9497265-Pyramimonas_sp.AAC.1
MCILRPRESQALAPPDPQPSGRDGSRSPKRGGPSEPPQEGASASGNLAVPTRRPSSPRVLPSGPPRLRTKSRRNSCGKNCAPGSLSSPEFYRAPRRLRSSRLTSQARALAPQCLPPAVERKFP